MLCCVSCCQSSVRWMFLIMVSCATFFGPTLMRYSAGVVLCTMLSTLWINVENLKISGKLLILENSRKTQFEICSRDFCISGAFFLGDLSPPWSTPVVPVMTYNVFGGTLNLAQIQHLAASTFNILCRPFFGVQLWLIWAGLLCDCRISLVGVRTIVESRSHLAATSCDSFWRSTASVSLPVLTRYQLPLLAAWLCRLLCVQLLVINWLIIFHTVHSKYQHQ